MTVNDTTFKSFCVSHGFRITPQRKFVFDSVMTKTNHPDVDCIWADVKEQIPSITRESVYRILNEFAEAGLIIRMDEISAARYEPNPKPHGHFICEKCGSIVDFPIPSEYLNAKFDIAGTMHHMDLRIVGLCPNCEK